MKSLLSPLRPTHIFLNLSLITLLAALAISTSVFTPVYAASSAAPKLSVQFTCAQAVARQTNGCF